MLITLCDLVSHTLHVNTNWNFALCSIEPTDEDALETDDSHRERLRTKCLGDRVKRDGNFGTSLIRALQRLQEIRREITRDKATAILD